jgi:hypothetical protein
MPREEILAAAKASRGVIPFPVPELGITHLRPLSGAEMTLAHSGRAPGVTVVQAVVALSICDEDGSRPLSVTDAGALADGIFTSALLAKVLEINRLTKEAVEDAGKGSAATPS